MAEKTRFGVLLKRYRIAAGLSQEALAERANLSLRAISDLERGINRSPRYTTLELLVNALPLSPQQRETLRAVVRDDAHPEINPSASAKSSANRTVIPLPPTRLVGRETERAQAIQAFQERKTRLLTLIGPSGVGKTRLALEIAQELAPDYSGNVVFVPLASVRDVAMVPNVIAQHLGLHEEPSQPFAEQIQTYLHDQSLLLLMDNLEQVLDCSPLVARLLETCPHLAVLATSRSPLRLRAEMELRLSPLPLSDATVLFSERADAIQPGREVPQTQVAAICEQLDCLPLAIELAARKVRLFSLPDLREQVTNRFKLLRDGARDLPARQQTMEDAIAWSYELLTEPQQRCFRAFGCFAGGWTLDAAEWVCSEQAFDIIASLVDDSLVQAEQIAEGAVRFSMLELIREYALIQLRAAGEMEACQRRHAEYYASLAEKAQAMFVAGYSDYNLSLIREEYNVQTAMHWAEAHHEAVLGLRMTGFARLWHITGQFSLAETWMERMLAIDHWNRIHGLQPAPSAMRIEHLSGLARILLGHGRFERAGAAITEALQLAESVDDPRVTGQAWMTCGLIAQAQGHLEEAELAFHQGQRYSETAGDDQLTTHLYVNLAEIARMRNDLDQADVFLNQALERAESAQAGWDTAIITTLQGFLANQQHHYRLASSRLREGLSRLRLFGSLFYTAWCLEGCAVTLLAEGRYQPAVCLCAAAVQLRQKAGSPLPPSEQESFEQVTGQLKTVLGQRIFSQEWEYGTSLPQEKVIDLALSSLD
jgi:predicted ATPase/DNA-binding XRE family transcriptional regulator